MADVRPRRTPDIAKIAFRSADLQWRSVVSKLGVQSGQVITCLLDAVELDCDFCIVRAFFTDELNICLNPLQGIAAFMRETGHRLPDRG